MLDAGRWMLDVTGNTLFLSSIEHLVTRISTLHAVKLINAYKLVGLRQSFASYVRTDKREEKSQGHLVMAISL